MVKKAPSILYTPEQAASLDRAQLASLGASALAELDMAAAASAGGPSNFFTSFEPTLVGNGAAGTLSGPRELLTAGDVAQLDELLESLLRALRPHVLHRAGLKLLEFLIRVHAVHRHCPRLVLITALPYHATPPFASLSKLVLDNLPQSSPLKKLPRGTAIQRATLASGAASAAAASAAAAAATLTQGVVYAASGAKRHKTGDGAFSSLAGEDAEGLLGTLCTDMVRMAAKARHCLLYTSPSPRDRQKSRMPSSA